MDDADIELQNATYRGFVERGRAPTAGEIAATLGMPMDAVQAGWRRLQAGHALVLDESGAIRMANPFSAVPTPFRVEAAGRSWYANCGWDGFGIGAALHVNSRFETECPDCGEPIRIDIRAGRPIQEDAVFHVLVPAAEWWNDIGFT